MVRRRATRLLVAIGAVSAALLVGSASASATFHLMKVREISPGTDGQDNSYVEIQMYAPFQNFLSNGAGLAVCNATCSLLPATFGPFTNVANGNSQDTVLFGDSGIPGGSKDFGVDLNLDQMKSGGAVCYLSEPSFTDCVSWGNFSADGTLTTNYDPSANPGSPAPALVSGSALVRSIAPGCPTMLEAGDDTNNSATDFSPAAPNPRTNAATPPETPCAGGGPTGYPPPGSAPVPSAKKKCKKAKKRAVAAKKCRKKRR